MLSNDELTAVVQDWDQRMLNGERGDPPPPGDPLADQVDAAARDVRVAARRMVEKGWMWSLEHHTYASYPGWLRLGALTAFLSWMLGMSETCLHSPAPQHPEPIIAAAWRPGRMVCGRSLTCGRLLALVPNSDQDRTCDSCKRVTAGTDEDSLSPGVLVSGAFSYVYGTCSDCPVPRVVPTV
jgi:hypothetical protein